MKPRKRHRVLTLPLFYSPLALMYENADAAGGKHQPSSGQHPARIHTAEKTRSINAPAAPEQIVATGSGALGTASTSNLGGTLLFTSLDPKTRYGAQLDQSFGSLSSFRTYGAVGYRHIRPWKCGLYCLGTSGCPRLGLCWSSGGHQVNLKFVHKSLSDKFAYFFDWSDKVEPNEDGIVLPSGYGTYVRPFTYPDFNYAKTYLNTPAYRQAGLNYRNYYSAAQRQDFLTYFKWQHDFSRHLHWDNSFYFHHNLGEGVVAGPISAAGLPTLFRAYFPDQNADQLSNVFSGPGYATRTTEYWDNRGGVISTLRYHLDRHNIELGGWYERNNNTQARRWYPLQADHPTTPYARQQNALINQYTNYFYTNSWMTHLQDSWKVSDKLTLLAGFKSELVCTKGTLPVAARPGSLSPATSITVPGGRIAAVKPFLPSFGALWNITPHEQLFANI